MKRHDGAVYLHLRSDLVAGPGLLQACRCGLADLEGIMPEIEPSGDRTHPAWKTICELKTVIKAAEGRAP